MNAVVPGSFLNSLPAELRQQFQDTSQSLVDAFGGRAFPRIGTRDNRFWLVGVDGAESPVLQVDPTNGSTYLDLIVLWTNPATTKAFYANPYQTGQDDTPDCASSTGLTPDAGVPAPQHTNCAACPKNAFGSASNGSGKACQDSKRVAVMLAAPTPVAENGVSKAVEAGTIWGYKLPPMTGKNLAAVVKELNKHNRALIEIVLRATFESQGVVKFTPVGWAPTELHPKMHHALVDRTEIDLACGINARPAAPALPASTPQTGFALPPGQPAPFVQPHVPAAAAPAAPPASPQFPSPSVIPPQLATTTQYPAGGATTAFPSSPFAPTSAAPAAPAAPPATASPAQPEQPAARRRGRKPAQAAPAPTAAPQQTTPAGSGFPAPASSPPLPFPASPPASAATPPQPQGFSFAQPGNGVVPPHANGAAAIQTAQVAPADLDAALGQIMGQPTG